MNPTRTFRDLGIKAPETKHLTGDKIKISKVLNREVLVVDYKIVPSKFENKGECLHLQIRIGENVWVLCVRAGFLAQMII